MTRSQIRVAWAVLAFANGLAVAIELALTRADGFTAASAVLGVMCVCLAVRR